MFVTLPSEAVVEAKVIGISVAVAAIIQVCKQAPVLQKYLQGWVAIVVNVVFSIAGVLAVVQPNQVFTLNTFTTVLTAALAAAGVHGTATKMMARHRAAVERRIAAEKAAAMEKSANEKKEE